MNDYNEYETEYERKIAAEGAREQAESRRRFEQSRRGFLQKAGALLGGLSLAGFLDPRVLSAAEQNEEEGRKRIHVDPSVKSVIFLNMAGGMSHIDTFDPKPGRDVAGPFGAVNSAIGGAKVSDRLSRTARELKNVSLIRSVHSEEGDHGRAQYLLHSGHRIMGGFADTPSFGSVIAFAKHKGGPYFPDHVTLGRRGGLVGQGGFLGTRYQAFHVSNVDRPLNNVQPRGRVQAERMARREQMLDMLNESFSGEVAGPELAEWRKIHASAVDFMNSNKLAVFDLEKEPAAVRARYGDTFAGKACLLARRLAQAEVPFIEVSIGGFDTHNNNRDRLTKILGELDPALAALLGELGSSGLLKQTVFVLSSEFGRTPRLSGAGDGRDHFPRAWTTLIGGGKIEGGRVIGATDKDGMKPEKDPVHLRNQVATIYRAAGIEPEEYLTSSVGRPFPLVPDPKPVKDLLG